MLFIRVMIARVPIFWTPSDCILSIFNVNTLIFFTFVDTFYHESLLSVRSIVCCGYHPHEDFMNKNKEIQSDDKVEVLSIDLLEWVNGGLRQDIDLSDGTMCVFWEGTGL